MTAPFEPASFLADSACVRAVIASPNHGERVGAGATDMLILHYTGLGPAGARGEWLDDQTGAATRWLCNPFAEVSAHYVVDPAGAVSQLVPESRRAWHAGRSAWAGVTDINSRSIGIEIVNAGHDGGLPPYPDAQIEAVIALCADIVTRHAIAADRVLAHSDIAPTRKADPGEHFPWERLHAAGVGHLVAPTPVAGGRFLQRGDGGPPVAALRDMLALYGYGLAPGDDYDDELEWTVRAFQRHFRRARVDGVADVSTIATLRDLIAARPPNVA